MYRFKVLDIFFLSYKLDVTRKIIAVTHLQIVISVATHFQQGKSRGKSNSWIYYDKELAILIYYFKVIKTLNGYISTVK
jgi:hypothetical protein